MSSPTQRSLAECKKRGWRACVVEKYNHHMKRRIDVFGFGDILVLDGEPGALLIQATAAGVSARVTKIKTECKDDAKLWLKAGNRIAVWGWTKRGKAGARKLWTLRTIEVTL